MGDVFAKESVEVDGLCVSDFIIAFLLYFSVDVSITMGWCVYGSISGPFLDINGISYFFDVGMRRESTFLEMVIEMF